MAEPQGTQKTLDSSVSTIRSQGLSFSKDGFDFTLNVPDTQDVKNVFGTMTTTIVTQELHIEEMTATMACMEVEFKRDQERIMQWAHEKIEKLSEKNDVLANVLTQTRQQLKAMTYNMKGIDDGTNDEDLVNAMKKIEESKTVKPTPVVTRSGSLFATEEGGSLSPNKLSARTQPAGKEHTPAPVIDPPKDDYVEVEPVTVQAKEVKSLLSETLAGGDDRPVIPKVVVLSEDRSPRGLWQWAYRKIAAKHMMTRIGFNFLNTIVGEEETVMSRLERIERRLFFIPSELRAYTDGKADHLNKKITDEVERLDSSLVAFDKQVCENFNDMGEKVVGVANDLSVVAADLANLRHTVEEVMSNSVGKMQGEVDELAQWRQDSYNHKLKSLIELYDDLSSQFKDMLAQADTVTSEVGTTIMNNQSVYDSDPGESLTTLLNIDTNMRNTRERLVRVEAGLKASTPALLSLKDDLLCILGEEVAQAELEDIENMLNKDFKSVVVSMNQASISLKQHDAIIAERWKSLSQMLKAVKEVSNISTKLETMESNIDSKVSPDEVADLAKPHIDTAIASALQPLEDRQESSKTQMMVLTERVTKVEISVDDAAMEGKPMAMVIDHDTPAPIRNSSEMADLSGLLHGGGDIEGALGPMIKGLVEMYCADWENGGGSSQDSFDRNNSFDGFNVNIQREDGDFDDNVVPEPDRLARTEDMDASHYDEEGEEDEEEGGRSNQHSRDGNDQRHQQQQQQQQHHQSAPQLGNQGGGDSQEHSVPNSNSNTRASSPRAAVKNNAQNNNHHHHHDDDGGAQQRSEGGHHHHQQQEQHQQHDAHREEVSTDGKTQSHSHSQSKPPPPSEHQQQQHSSSHSAATGQKHRPDKSSSRQPSHSKHQRTDNSVSSADVSSGTPSGRDPHSRDNHKGRGRGRGGGVDPAEMQGLRQEVFKLNEKLSDLSLKKIDVEAVKLLMLQKADSKHLARKVDADVVTTIEDAVKACLQNIGDLKQMQGEEITDLKADLGRKIKDSLKAMFKSKEDESKGANASAQAICLTCGQDSPMKVHPTKHAAPGFLPALNSHATAGPDVHRGGFKLPVHIPTKVSKYADFLDDDFSRELSQEMTIKAAGGASLPSPEGNIGERSFESSNQSSSSRKQPLVRPSSTSTSSYKEDQSAIRPLFRKGFPAKKTSSRPSAYAPERYELDPHIQVITKNPSKKRSND